MNKWKAAVAAVLVTAPVVYLLRMHQPAADDLKDACKSCQGHHHCNVSPWWDSKGDHRCVCGTKASDWIHADKCSSASLLQTTADDLKDACKSCQGHHNCNVSPWWDSKGDHRCVCGTKASDWIHADKCSSASLLQTVAK